MLSRRLGQEVLVLRLKGILFYSFFIALSISFFCSYAIDQIQIQDHTESKKSVILNKGSLDGLTDGDYGYFYFQEKKDAPKIVKVAKAVLVQLNSTNSSWLIKEVYQPEYIKRKQSLILYSRSRHDLGKRDFSIRSNKVYLQSQTSADEYLEDKEIGAPKSQRLIEDLYTKEKGDITATVVDGRDMDVESTEFHQYDVKTLGKDKRLSVEEDGRYVETQALRDVYEDEYYQSSVDGWEQKAKSFDSLESMYKRKLKDVDVKEGQEYLTVNNSYREALDEKSDKVFLNRRAIKKMSMEGNNWSADMDDQEIRKFIVNSGIIEESDRKSFALKNSLGHEFYLRYSFGMTQNTTDEDDSYNGPGFGINLGYELFMERLTQHFRRLTFDFGLEFSNNYFDPNLGYNVKSVETSITAMANYYFWNYPTTLDRILLFVGYGMKSGSATLQSQYLSKDYSYNVRSFATLQTGLKYRIGASDLNTKKIGIGFLALLQYETQSYTSDAESEDDLDGEIGVNDLKMSLGMSFYF